MATNAAAERDGLQLMRLLADRAEALLAAEDAQYAGTDWENRSRRLRLARQLTTLTHIPASSLMLQRQGAAPLGGVVAGTAESSRPSDERMTKTEAIALFMRDAGTSLVGYVLGPESTASPNGGFQWFGPGAISHRHYLSEFDPTRNGLARTFLEGVTNPLDVPVEAIRFAPSTERPGLTQVHYSFNPKFMGEQNPYTEAAAQNAMPRYQQYGGGRGIYGGGVLDLGFTLTARRAQHLLQLAQNKPGFVRDLVEHAILQIGPKEFAGLWQVNDGARMGIKPPYEQLPPGWSLWIFDGVSPATTRRQPFQAYNPAAYELHRVLFP
jgi:hypothetical protein